MPPETTTLSISLTPTEAWAYAQHLKRMGFSDYREKSKTEAEAYESQSAAEKLRAALAQSGYAPR